VSLLFAQEGANLILHWYDGEEKVEQLSRQCESEVVMSHTIFADLSQRSGTAALIDYVHRTVDRIDVLVNNAQNSETFKRAEDFPHQYDDWERTVAVNLTATAHLSHWAVQSMPSGSAIINITSIQAVFAGELSWAYGATKGALEQLTKRIAVEAGTRGIRANALRPGLILTDRNSDYWNGEGKERLSLLRELYPLRRVGMPIDVARVCVFLASDEASFITGASIAVDGGLAVVNAALGAWGIRESLANSPSDEGALES
jgi:NAD(P)-dependent dehydrogenase (short-subunit alcohol dehydrogenase family)